MTTIQLCTVCCAKTSGTVYSKNSAFCSEECLRLYKGKSYPMWYHEEFYPGDDELRMIRSYDYARRIMNRVRNKKARKLASQLKKDIFFEPQAMEGLANFVSSVSGLAGGISDIARAVHNCAVKGMDIPDGLTARVDSMLEGLNVLNGHVGKLASDGLDVNIKDSDSFLDVSNKFVLEASEMRQKGVPVNAKIDYGLDLGFGNFFRWCLENKSTVGVFAICFLVCALIVKKGNKEMILALMSLIGSFLLFSKMSSSLTNLYQKIVDSLNGGDIEPQSFDSSITRSLLLLGYLSVFRNLNFETLTSKFNSIVNVMARAPQTTDKFAGVMEYYASICQNLFNKTMEWIGVDFNVNWFGDRYPHVTRLVKDCEDFLKGVDLAGKDLIINKTCQTSQLLRNQIVNVILKHKDDRDFAGCQRILIGLRSRLEALDKELDLRGAGKNVTRVAPKAFLFMGMPGIGKSYLLRTLCTMLLYKIFAKDKLSLDRLKAGQFRDFVFTRNSDDKFWEGYYNQPIVHLDEVAMTRDVAGGNAETNEYSSFVKMVNDVVYPLLMANVEKKGMSEFDSDAILGTTNARIFQIESINNREAYARRWIKFDVRVKPEFAYLYKESENSAGWNRPDFNKIESMLSEEDIALSRFLEFRERRSLFNEEYVGDWFGIDELIERVRIEMDKREKEKLGNKKHTEILNEIFGPKGSEAEASADKKCASFFDRLFDQNKSDLSDIPGDFAPQSLEEGACPCKVCTHSYNVSFSVAEKFEHKDKLGVDYHIGPDWSSFLEGYNSVTDKNALLYTEEPRCFRDVLTDNECRALGHTTQTCSFVYGAQVRSAYIRDYVEAPLQYNRAVLRNTCMVALKFLGVVGSILGIYKLCTMLFMSTDDKNKAKAKVRQNNLMEANAKTFEDLKPQFVDLNAQEVLECVLKRNVYAVGDNIIPFTGFVTFIADNAFLMPKHFLLRWREELEKGSLTEVTFRRLGDKVDHQIVKVGAKIFLRDDCLITFSDDLDLVAFYLDNKVMTRHASIRKYLPDADSIRPRGEALVPRVNFTTLEYQAVSAPYQVANLNVGYESHGEKCRITKGIAYSVNTASGDCGLPVAIKDPLIRKSKIFGIHVAGSKSREVGMSIPITTQTYDSIITCFESRFNIIHAQYRTDANAVLEMSKEGKCWDDLFAVPEHMEIPGKVNLGYLEPPTVPVKTSIVPSPLFKKLDFKPKTKPAWLRPFTKDGVTIDPNAIATTKYHKSVESFDIDVLDVCKNSVTDIVLNNPLNRDDERMGRRVLSFKEAVEGIAGVEGFYGIPRKTSAGYPRCKSVSERGKRDFFGESGDYVLDSEKAQEIELSVSHIVGSAKNNIRENHVFLDFPKDERRPKDKADSGKTRKISACPVDLAIAIRMYFGCFVQYFMANRIYNQSAVGVNVFDSQWELIASYLGEDNRVIAGDFSNYDGRLPYCVMIRFLDTVTDFYADRGTESERVREVLFQELVNSKHIMGGVIYEWVGSNASGNPLTTVLNSWCNLVLLRYATLMCVDKLNVREGRKFLREMDENVRFMVYGDDNLISIRRGCPYAHLLTQDAYTEAFSKMGLEYTDESKSGGQVDQDRSITDVAFLKRKWARNSIDPRRRYLSPLALETILESIQWTKKQDILLDAVKDNVVNMLQELSQHEEVVFNEWAPKIVSCCKEEMNFVPLPNTYRECQTAVLAREMSF